MNARAVRVLVVASAGGHWVQLFRLRLSWAGCRAHYVTTTGDYRPEVMADGLQRGEAEPGYTTVTEANRWQKLRLARLLLEIALILVRTRPDVVISTGAAPGYFAIRIARLLGARTVWVDSIANAEELSLCGQRVARYADVWLTQWEELSCPGGPQFWGSVI